MEKYGFVDDKGEWKIPPRFDAVGVFSEGLANVRIGDKRGYIDTSGEVVIPLEFDGAKPFRCGHGCVTIKREEKYVTRAGKVAFSEMRAPKEGLAAVKRRGLWGFIDEKGNYCIEPTFKDVQDFSEGFAGVTDTEGKCGFIDKSGKLVVPARYDSVDDFHDGFATVTYNRDDDFAVGLIDAKGKEIFVPTLEAWIHGVSKGLVRRQTRAKKDGDWKPMGFGLVDLKGKEIVAPRYTFIAEFAEDLACFKVGRDLEGREGFMRPDGSIAIEAKFFDADSFSGGRAWVNDVKPGKITKFAIDREGTTRVKLPKGASDATPFKDRVSILSANDGKQGLAMSGLIRDDGEILLPRKYSQVKVYANGLVRIALGSGDDALYGIANTKGEVLVPPKWTDLGELDAALIPAKEPSVKKKPPVAYFLNAKLEPATKNTYVDTRDYSEGLAGAAIVDDAATGKAGAKKHPFLFWGVQPADYFTDTGCFAIRFAQTPDKATQARIKKFTKQALEFHQPKWEWKKDSAVLWLGEDLGQPDTFENVAKALLELHETIPILEVVNHYAREAGTDPWDKWTYAQQKAPSRGLDDPNGMSTWSS
jgi:hypothetical protein